MPQNFPKWNKSMYLVWNVILVTKQSPCLNVYSHEKICTKYVEKNMAIRESSAFSTLKWNTCHNTTYKINVCLCLCLRLFATPAAFRKSFFPS